MLENRRLARQSVIDCSMGLMCLSVGFFCRADLLLRTRFSGLISDWSRFTEGKKSAQNVSRSSLYKATNRGFWGAE